MEEVQGEPALGVSMNIQVSGTRQIVFQTHVAAATSKDTLDALLDKLNEAGDRVEAFYQIGVYEQELQRARQILLDLNHRLSTVDDNAAARHRASGKRSDFKLTAQEETHKIQATDQVRIQTRVVGECEARLAETVKKAGTRYASPTDRDAGVPDRKVP